MGWIADYKKRVADIDGDVILRFLAKHQGEWMSWFDWEGRDPEKHPTIYDAFGPPINDRDVLAKCKELHWLGLVGGCPCGCRGDFEITDLGLAHIGENRTAGYSGYGESPENPWESARLFFGKGRMV